MTALVAPTPTGTMDRLGEPLLEVDDLTITYRTDRRVPAVKGVSFRIFPREAYGLVGESGCGKSTVAFAVMRYLAANGRVDSGAIRLAGQDVLALSPAELQRLRGSRVAMVYQDPGAALNPSMTVGEQVAEVFAAHGHLDGRAARAAAVDMLAKVRMPGAEAVAARYPHQLSGGMQQRVVIAMALALNPSLLILDEPTTGLDATVEAAILDLIADVRREYDVAVLLISHNLAVVSQLCDRVGVLYAGELVEEGPTAELFAAPHHPYTAGLISCVPRVGMRKDTDPLVPIPGRMPRLGEVLPGCPYAPRCPLARDRCVQEHPPLYPTTDGRHARCHFWPEAPALLRSATPEAVGAPVAPAEDLDGRPDLLTVQDAEVRFGRGARQVKAVNDVTFEVHPGEVFGLVGESGSGKSTIARCVAGLISLDDGRLTLEGQDITAEVEGRERPVVRRIQMVFQSPEATLNPRQTVRQTLSRAVRSLTDRRGDAVRQRVDELAGMVALDPALLGSYPGGLSGGQRQRVAIARAFAGDPDVVLCDEPVSNLDVSIQATILNLLADLQARRSVSSVFISHDLGVVRYLADRVGVLYLGALVEVGPVDRVFSPPFHPYTETLFAAMPTLGGVRGTVRAEGSMPSAAEIPSGCPFHTRCPRFLGRQCVEEVPPWRQTAQGHAYRCWIEPEPLAALQRETVSATASGAVPAASSTAGTDQEGGTPPTQTG